MYLLDVSAYNSFVLFKIKFENQINDVLRARRFYLEDLTKYLIFPAIEKRYVYFSLNNFSGISRDIQLSMQKFIKFQHVNASEPERF